MSPLLMYYCNNDDLCAQGHMNDVDVASIEDMLNTEAGLGAAGLGGLLIPAPPLTLLRHRDPRLLCRLGTRSYCPGEILFRCRGNAGYMLNNYFCLKSLHDAQIKIGVISFCDV